MTLIDESYNANPASMEAAIALLGATAPHGAGRRIAVLGDMLELGPEAPRLHAELGGPLVRAGVDRLFLAGALMENLWRAAPAAMRARREADAASLAATFADDIKDGDVVMVKGSNASKISAVVKALIASAAPNED
jgi:UDP-N-acetylmuramoyl-tripeptide--D-alanyl-D-alanine ligase